MSTAAAADRDSARASWSAAADGRAPRVGARVPPDLPPPEPDESPDDEPEPDEPLEPAPAPAPEEPVPVQRRWASARWADRLDDGAARRPGRGSRATEACSVWQSARARRRSDAALSGQAIEASAAGRLVKRLTLAQAAMSSQSMGPDTCGNTLARLLANLQHHLDARASFATAA